MPSKTKWAHYREPRMKREFIRDLYPVAVETSSKLKDKGYVISPLVILSMAAVESSWGEEVTGNMYFEKEIELPAKKGEKKQLLIRRRLHKSPNHFYQHLIEVLPLKDGQYKYIVREWFKNYESPLDNFMEHFMEIVGSGSYDRAVELGENDRLFVTKLAELGYTYNKRYAPEARYAEKVILAMKMIERNFNVSINLPHQELYPARTLP